MKEGVGRKYACEVKVGKHLTPAGSGCRVHGYLFLYSYSFTVHVSWIIKCGLNSLDHKNNTAASPVRCMSAPPHPRSSIT